MTKYRKEFRRRVQAPSLQDSLLIRVTRRELGFCTDLEAKSKYRAYWVQRYQSRAVGRYEGWLKPLTGDQQHIHNKLFQSRTEADDMVEKLRRFFARVEVIHQSVSTKSMQGLPGGAYLPGVADQSFEFTKLVSGV